MSRLKFLMLFYFKSTCHESCALGILMPFGLSNFFSARHKCGIFDMGCSCSKQPEPRSGHGPTLLSSVPKQRTRAQKGPTIRISCHASEGSKWHLELLAVSEDLQKQLQDPQFVATRCDLDGSGDLDPHELRQAARVYGIDPGPGDGSAELMAGQRMSKGSFAEMVALRSQERPLIRALDRYG